ncbi:VIT1/CCC1 transporter family protein [Sulfolobus acidocaldarius]|nr:hypothetical protein SacN8_01360 [Sulfolobus acidocaldarius N8]
MNIMEEPIVHNTHEADIFRTKVFGIQDGLIGVGALISGASGYSHDPLIVLVTGLLATIAQAFSMGVGEYISTRVRSQIIENEIKKEKFEIENYPEKEKEELKSFYMQKGLTESEAEKIANKIMTNKYVVLQEMLIHELKMTPEEFESPVKLGFLMSFYLIVGGIIPLIPFILGMFFSIPFLYLVVSSMAVILVTLAIFGVLSTKYTGLSKSRGAFEQIGTGLIALIGSYFAGMIISYFIPLPQHLVI